MDSFFPPPTLYGAYLIDLDGTVYLGGERLLPTARETILRLQELGCRVIFLTNDATTSRLDFARRLERLGLPALPEQIASSSAALVDYLNQHLPGGRLFVIGEPSLQALLEAAGFILTEDPHQVQAVIASSDRDFHFRKLRIAFDAIRSGAAFLATNADRACPLPDGGFEPDALPVIAAIEACTGRTLDFLVGKPSTYLAEMALRLAGLPPAQCLLVGDNLETDIQMGLRAGLPTALALTGMADESTLQGASIRPDFVIRRLEELIPQGLSWRDVCQKKSFQASM